MDIDRLEMLAAISFVEPAIPKKSETNRNCLFVRVEDGRIVFFGGSEYVVKKAVLNRPNTTGDQTQKKALPKTFMIPVTDLLAFKEMMDGHKGDCKKMAKNDPSHLLVEINNLGTEGKKGLLMEMISHDGKVIFQQPRFDFKDLDALFQVKKSPISEVDIMQADITPALKGFRKSKKIEMTMTGPGPKDWVHFGQDDFEAMILPAVEKEEGDGNEQTELPDE